MKNHIVTLKNYHNYPGNPVLLEFTKMGIKGTSQNKKMFTSRYFASAVTNLKAKMFPSPVLL